MLSRFLWLLAIGCSAFRPELNAQAPPLLAKAFAQWDAGRQDLAFTQQTRFFSDDGSVKEERVERYDPSLPDSRRWRLIEVDGQPATLDQREKWETKKNGKARKKVVKSPSEYLDLAHATTLGDTPRDTRFEIGLRPAAARLLGVEIITAQVTVDKQTGNISQITAALHQPLRVLLGLAKITDLDIDIRIGQEDGGSDLKSVDVQSGSTASVTMSKLGNPMEYNWSDFKRVTSYGAPPPSADAP